MELDSEGVNWSTLCGEAIISLDLHEDGAYTCPLFVKLSDDNEVIISPTA